jgi:rare lipoprotein A (peptidoglycan hydrolase)
LPNSPDDSVNKSSLLRLMRISILFGLLSSFLLSGAVEASPIYLKASYYSTASLHKDGQWKKTKGVMANGKLFRDGDLTCACNLVPLGSALRVKNKNNGKTVVVTVTDHINRRFTETRIDLTPLAFSSIAELKEGLVAVKVERIK